MRTMLSLLWWFVDTNRPLVAGMVAIIAVATFVGVTVGSDR